MNSRKSLTNLNKIEGYIKKLRVSRREPFESSIGVIHMVLRKTKHIWLKCFFLNLREEKKTSFFHCTTNNLQNS